MQGSVGISSHQTRCCAFPRSAPCCAIGANSVAITTHRMMDGPMDRKILPQDRPNNGAGLIAILLLSLCLWPVVWELVSVIPQYL
jgi:hypothetical protein